MSDLQKAGDFGRAVRGSGLNLWRLGFVLWIVAVVALAWVGLRGAWRGQAAQPEPGLIETLR